MNLCIFFFLTWLKANHCNLFSVEMSMPSSSSSWSYSASNYSNSLRKTDMHNRFATLSYYVTNLSMTTNLSLFSFLVYIDTIQVYVSPPRFFQSLQQSSGKLVETLNLWRGIRITDEVTYTLKTDLTNTWGPKFFDVIKISRKSLMFVKYKSTYGTVEPLLTDTSATPAPRQ